jgi:kinesin family protein C2/C3
MKKLEESLQIIENKAKGKDHVHKNLQEKIKELEGQIELKTSTQNQSEKQISQLCEKLKGKEETCCTLQQKVAFYSRLTCGSSIYFLVTVLKMIAIV